MKKKRRSAAVRPTGSGTDLAGRYLQLTHLRQIVQEAERLRGTRRPRQARRYPLPLIMRQTSQGFPNQLTPCLPKQK
jgi:hypothetical protein